MAYSLRKSVSSTIKQLEQLHDSKVEMIDNILDMGIPEFTERDA